MKNIEKYFDEWNHCDDDDIMCFVHSKRTGSEIKCEGICRECYIANTEWMNAEYKEPILTDQEKGIIKHFIDAYSGIGFKVIKVAKANRLNVECLKFKSDSTDSFNCVTQSPEFSEGKMFKGMKLNEFYTVEELLK